MDFLEIISITLISLLVIITFLPLLKSKLWWIRMMDFPRLQVLFLLLVALVLIAYFLDDGWLKVALVFLGFLAGAIQISYLYTFLPFTKVQIKSKRKIQEKKSTFKFLISNVYMYNKEYPKLVKLVKKMKPDIFLAVEVDQKWVDGMSPVKDDFLYHVEYPQDNTYGMILYSNIDMLSKNIRFLLKDDIPSIHAQMIINGKEFKLICVHPEPPAPGEASTSVPRDRELIKVADYVSAKDEPVIVAGDLNDVAWSDTTRQFVRTSELLDPRVGRGFFNTFNAKYFFMRWSLDHIFVSPHFMLRGMKRCNKIGSDHFPFLIELYL